jgi:hypothetical protein
LQDFGDMKAIFHNADKRRVTGLLSLFVYVYALVLLPVLHSHYDSVGDLACVSNVCSCLELDSFQSCLDSRDNCAGYEIEYNHEECHICKILCTTIPLFESSGGVIIVTNILIESFLISDNPKVQFACGEPSCRAPPAALSFV